MKGHMEKDGFHPHTQSKGVRKSRDQLTKTEGIKIERKKRFISEDDLDRKSNLEIDALFKEVEKSWTKNELISNEGDGQALVYTNKEDPDYTFELHPLTEEEFEDPDGNKLEEPILTDAWYWFPTKNEKALQNSPFTLSETGGYTRKDAIREFKKDFISYDQEFSS